MVYVSKLRTPKYLAEFVFIFIFSPLNTLVFSLVVKKFALDIYIIIVYNFMNCIM